MEAIEKVLEVLENATLAELHEELELLEKHEDKYPAYFKQLLLAELEKRKK